MSERRGGAALTRLRSAWRTLTPEGRMATFAALGLFLTMFLPWYQQNAVVEDRVVSPNLTAFGVFSFVEAAVLLVAIAVLVLLFARAEGRSFHLPGGDGTIVMVAGAWVALLLVWRLFDKPDLSGEGVGTVGIQWGIFFALGAAGLLALAGSRMRAADRPARNADGGPPSPRRRRAETPAEPAAPGTARTPVLPPEPPRATRASATRQRRRAQPPAWEEQPSDGVVERPAQADPPTRRLPDPPTERLPEPPTRRRADPPTERMADPPARRRADPPTERMTDPPTEQLPDAESSAEEPPTRRIRARRPEQSERLFDEG